MKTLKTTVVLAAAALALTGCAANDAAGANEQPQQTNASAAQADALQTHDTWAKAADSGMSAAFGVLHNDSDAQIQITGASDAVGNEIQLHETTGTGENASMQELDEPASIAPGEDYILEPGGNHLMFMDLVQPLLAAQTTNITLEFADGSSADVDFEIRNFTGANESYDYGEMDHDDMDHGDHDG